MSRYEDGDKEDVSFPELSEMLVRREDEPELQSDGEAAAAQDGEAKDNGGKDDSAKRAGRRIRVFGLPQRQNP